MIDIPDFDFDAPEDDSFGQEVVTYSPQPGPQTMFLACEADIACYGGQAGGGKTYAILLDLNRMTSLPGTHTLVLRRTLAAAKASGSVWTESMKVFPDLGGVPNISSLTWKWPHKTGVESTAMFAGIEHEKDLEQKYQGGQYHAVYFDELTHFTERMFWYLRGRARNSTKHEIRPYIRATMNPEPDSWVHRMIMWWLDDDGYPIPERSGVIRWVQRYQDENVWGDTREECVSNLIARGASAAECQPSSFTFISARLEDNPALMQQDPGYVAALSAQTEYDRKRLRDGCWKADHSRKLFAPIMATMFQALHPNVWETVVLVDAARGRRDKAGNATGHATGIVVARVAATPLGIRAHIVHAEHWRGTLPELPAYVVGLADAHQARHVALDSWSAATNDTLAQSLNVHEIRSTDAKEIQWARELRDMMHAGRVACAEGAFPDLEEDLRRLHDSSGTLVVPEYPTPEGISHCDAAMALLRLVPVAGRILPPEDVPEKPPMYAHAHGVARTGNDVRAALRASRLDNVRSGDGFRKSR